MEFLNCEVQEYAWGDTESIPRLLGEDPDGTPKAELWMGAHPRASSRTESGTPLNDLIAADLDSTLGPTTAARFGQLPFLFKVLAAAAPLSIQSHPTLEQAIEGFARENREGIPIDAPDRVYRDPNHKPELIAAVTPFVAKCGFRPLAESRQLFSLMAAQGGCDALRPIAQILEEPGDASTIYKNALAYILGSPASQEVKIADATMLASMALRGTPQAADHDDELGWTDAIIDAFPNDSGVSVALLLNHVVLEPGDAIFLEAGNLHAYLWGTGMELMANSDNVVRGGLTPKHRDVPELLNVVECSPIDAPVQHPPPGTWTYNSPVPEFTLDRLVDPDDAAVPTGPEIIFVQTGSLLLESSRATVDAAPGSVVWIPADEGLYSIRGSGTSWRARV